jgi:hypothetical protein
LADGDCLQSRHAFVSKFAALLQRNVCVSLVDKVTIRQFNLYADPMEFIGATDPALNPDSPRLYAVTLLSRKRPRQRSLLESWFHPIKVGPPAIAASSELAGC